MQPAQLVQSGSLANPSTHAQVKFASGLLTVSTQNASLNEVLREIGRVTGMRIIGAIADERVFGTYGPSAPQDVLSQLLEGTGTNILLHEDAQHSVRELMLTARQGGVTPPGPPSSHTNDDADMPPQILDRRRHVPGSLPDFNTGVQPGNPTPRPQASQPASPAPLPYQPPPNGQPAPPLTEQQKLMQEHLSPHQDPTDQ